MRKRQLGRSGLSVSEISLGTMNFGFDWHSIGAIDESTARTLVDIAIERGVNSFDTADIYGYGAAEEMLGKILAGRRSSVIIASKVLGRMRPEDPSSGGLSRRHIMEAVEASLRRLKTEYLDLYMPHGWDRMVPLEESLEAFSSLVGSGKVRVLGCSNFNGSQLLESLHLSKNRKWQRFEFNQIQYSLAFRFPEKDLVPVCQKEEISLLAWSPLGGGWLTGKYHAGHRPKVGRRLSAETAFPPLPEQRLERLMDATVRVGKAVGRSPAQVALAWVLSRPAVASVIIGARNREQLEENLALPVELSSHSKSLLELVGVASGIA